MKIGHDIVKMYNVNFIKRVNTKGAEAEIKVTTNTNHTKNKSKGSKLNNTVFDKVDM